MNDLRTIICMTEMNANGHCGTFSCQLFLKKLQEILEISIFGLLLMVCQQSSMFMMAGDGVKQRDVLEDVTINIYFSLLFSYL